MIYSGKSVSVRNVIAKVYRDLDMREEASLGDFIEWSAEAMEKIGAFTQLESKRVEVNINNYIGEMPTDLVYLTLVTYNNFPILPTEDVIDPIKIDDGTRSTRPYAFYQSKIQNKTFVSDSGFENNGQDRGMYESVKYKVSNGLIKTSFETGCLSVVYESLPLDEDGFPLIPDYVEFKEAIYWYINMKYSYPLWRRGEIRDGIYQDAEQKFHWYCQQAANKAMIPDLGKLENIKRSYLSLKPRTEEFLSFYNDLNKSPERGNYY